MRLIWLRVLGVLAVALAAVSAGNPVIAKGIAIDCSSFLPTSTMAASPSATGAASSGAGDADPVAFPAEGGTVDVFAAASLIASFTEIEAQIEAANSNVNIVLNFAGSQALVTQLTEGAAADVFASASIGPMSAAIEAGVIDGSPVIFTQNRLAIVVPADNPAGIETYADLGGDLRLVLALPEVPIGLYTRQSLCTAGEDRAEYGEGFVQSVAANVVSEEDNVKAVLTKVMLGEADAGIVYTTDITADVSSEVTIIDVPADVNVVASYPIAPVAGGEAALASAFISYVTGPEGQAILQEYGFDPKP